MITGVSMYSFRGCNPINKNATNVVKKVTESVTSLSADISKKVVEHVADPTVDIAWWREGYNEAKKIEEQIARGEYKPKEAPEIYRDDGGINLAYFLGKD